MKHPLEEVRWGVIPIVYYKGCLVEKTKDGYKVLKMKCSTPHGVDLIIQKASEGIQNSLIK